jgi:hypothetical protein
MPHIFQYPVNNCNGDLLDCMDAYALILFLQCDAVNPPCESPFPELGYTPWLKISTLSTLTLISEERIISTVNMTYPYMILLNAEWVCCLQRLSVRILMGHLSTPESGISTPQDFEHTNNWPRHPDHSIGGM